MEYYKPKITINDESKCFILFLNFFMNYLQHVTLAILTILIVKCVLVPDLCQDRIQLLHLQLPGLLHLLIKQCLPHIPALHSQVW